MRNHVLAFALVAAALSQTAGAITATKEYVDRKNTEIRTNTYTKAETDARIGELAPRTSLAPATNYTDSATNRLVQLLTDPDDFLQVARAENSVFARNAEFATSAHRADSSDGLITIDDDESRSAETIFSQIDARTTTNDVRNIVTNETVTPTGDWVLDESRTYLDEDIIVSEPPSWNGSNWVAEIFDGDMYRIYTAEGGFDALELNFVVNGWEGAHADIWYTRPGEIKNALGLARRSDITNTVTKAYVEGLGIEAGISAETATNIAEGVVNATVTGVVRAVSFKVKDYIFDPVTEICWRRQMVNGFLDYIAVTNIDVTLPENYEALEALERRDNQ